MYLMSMHYSYLNDADEAIVADYMKYDLVLFIQS